MSKQSVRKTLKEFVAQCKEKHGDTYDYSESVYLGSYKKIAIKCRIHGVFWQWPNDHRHGVGCPNCSGNKRKTTEEFITQAKEIFPHFDFSKVDYKSALKHVIIICPTHGDFLQKPNGILNGVGCEKCSIERMLKTKIERKIIADPADKSEYENYRRKVWRTSNQQYKLHKDKINPENLPRSLKYHLDHKYSIQQGWVNGKSAEEIGDWTNLQILEGRLNRQKGNKCTRIPHYPPECRNIYANASGPDNNTD